MTRRTLILLLFVLTLPLGCSNPDGKPYTPPEMPETTSALREPTAAELAKLVDLAEVVVRGIVQERKAAPEGVSYVVEVQEVLHETASSKANPGFPHAEGREIRISAFLFKSGQAQSQIGVLKEPNRYLFFLTPMERDGWWLNLDDAAAFPLPEADKTLRDLRDLRDLRALRDGGTGDE